MHGKSRRRGSTDDEEGDTAQLFPPLRVDDWDSSQAPTIVMAVVRDLAGRPMASTPQLKRSMRFGYVAAVILGSAGVASAKLTLAMQVTGESFLLSLITAASIMGLYVETTGLIVATVGCIREYRRLPERYLGWWLPHGWPEHRDTLGRCAFGYPQAVLIPLGAGLAALNGVQPGVIVCAGCIGSVISAVIDACRYPGKRRLRYGMILATSLCVIFVVVANGDAFLKSSLNSPWALLALLVGLSNSCSDYAIQIFANRLGAAKQMRGHEQSMMRTQLYVGVSTAGCNALVLAICVFGFGARMPAMPWWTWWLVLPLVGVWFAMGSFVRQTGSVVKGGKAAATEMQMTATVASPVAITTDLFFGGTLTVLKIVGSVMVPVTALLIGRHLSPKVHADRHIHTTGSGPAGTGPGPRPPRR